MNREQQISDAAQECDITANRHDLDCFEAGARWADAHPGWIDINEKQPPLGVEVNAYNKEWIDEDFNPNGTRVGFMTDHGFYSAFWWNYQDCYMTISNDEVDSDRDFYKSHIGKTEPTHWMPIVPPKFD